MERISDREAAYVAEVLATQFRSSSGSDMTGRLERLFAAKFDCPYAIAFINGTATMHAALTAAGIGPGDEVIVPPLTMASTSLAVLHAGALPVFADVDPHRWTLDANVMASAVTPRTRAVIPVALYGLMPDMEAIMAVAKTHNLFVLEDDAQCFRGYHDGKIAGSIGHAASFSFQSSKHMTSGEGGMITTGDLELAEKIRRFGSLGYAGVGAGAGKGRISRDDIQDPGYARHTEIGWNYRLPELCAAVALAQLERLEELVSLRAEAAARYAQALDGCDWLIPQKIPQGYKHAWWTFPVLLSEAVDFTWHDFRRQYRKFGGDAFYAAWRLTYLEPAFYDRSFCPGQWQRFADGLCPVAESLQPGLIQLKTNYYDAAQMDRQAEALAQTIAYFG